MSHSHRAVISVTCLCAAVLVPGPVLALELERVDQGLIGDEFVDRVPSQESYGRDFSGPTRDGMLSQSSALRYAGSSGAALVGGAAGPQLGIKVITFPSATLKNLVGKEETSRSSG